MKGFSPFMERRFSQFLEPTLNLHNHSINVTN